MTSVSELENNSEMNPNISPSNSAEKNYYNPYSDEE